MADRTTLTRNELYKLVWQKPIAQIAAEYGISDVAFAKLCKRRNVPRPPRGYWARVEAGQRPPKTPLPPSKKDLPVTLSRHEPGDAKATKATDELAATIAREKRAENHIVVSDRLQAASPLILDAKELLQGAQSDTTGLLKKPSRCLDLRVSSGQLARALRIADALVKHFGERGWEVKVTGDATIVHVNDTPLGFGIEEGLETVELPIKPNLSGSYSFHHSQRQTTKKPSGKLSVSIDERTHLWNHSQRRNWHETDKRPLEDHLNDVVVGLLKLAAAVKTDHERRAVAEREEQERRRKAQVALEEQKRLRAALADEKERVKVLFGQATRWRESQNLRLFVQEARERGGIEGVKMSPEHLAEWVEWALRQADRLDPFVASPHSILDDAERIEHMCDGLRGVW